MIRQSTNPRNYRNLLNTPLVKLPFWYRITPSAQNTRNPCSNSQSTTLLMQTASPLTRDAQITRLPNHLSEELNWNQRSHNATNSKPKPGILHENLISFQLGSLQRSKPMKQLKQNDNGKLRPHKNKPIKLQQIGRAHV